MSHHGFHADHVKSVQKPGPRFSCWRSSGPHSTGGGAGRPVRRGETAGPVGQPLVVGGWATEWLDSAPTGAVIEVRYGLRCHAVACLAQFVLALVGHHQSAHRRVL